MYAIIYGKNPRLSEAEFLAFTKRFGLKIKIIESSKHWMVFDGDKSVERLFHKLGGSLKLVKIVGEEEEAIRGLEYTKHFTVSIYGKDDWKLWRKLGSGIKKHFKSQGSSKFFKPAKVYAMPSELVLKGFPEVKDFVFIFGRNLYVGETIAVADPFELKKLDVERPVQRAILSIPPRLARIMVNLTEIRQGNFLDPFCGIGTIVQEFLLQGLNAYGSDSNPKAINGAKENLKWLKKEFRVRKSAHLEVCDARKLKRCFRVKFDAIVTEPYMGKPLKYHPTKGEAIKLANELDRFYYTVFDRFRDVLKRHGRVVFVFPAYKLNDGRIYRKERKWLEKLGFEVMARYTDFEERHRVVRDIHVLRYNK
ncbi:site-specific DNA-methyltransferase [Thermococcus argininiproducens]|uniref:Site-specific DNA-methyltransferase n=1 Tax=Thermococcus argininiproducens TaxID=2866384 RepID=A0A9E7M9T6_9EURY|nr:TRM11 family methyltransferase [Thermococcus argininiproducens]USH00077.1 site-specific DNA-methyltransferase [Thermococcus argininiproducens]